jgi:hypothetical protein
MKTEGHKINNPLIYQGVIREPAGPILAKVALLS